MNAIETYENNSKTFLNLLVKKEVHTYKTLRYNISILCLQNLVPLQEPYKVASANTSVYSITESTSKS